MAVAVAAAAAAVAVAEWMDGWMDGWMEMHTYVYFIQNAKLYIYHDLLRLPHLVYFVCLSSLVWHLECRLCFTFTFIVYRFVLYIQ